MEQKGSYTILMSSRDSSKHDPIASMAKSEEVGSLGRMSTS